MPEPFCPNCGKIELTRVIGRLSKHWYCWKCEEYFRDSHPNLRKFKPKPYRAPEKPVPHEARDLPPE